MSYGILVPRVIALGSGKYRLARVGCIAKTPVLQGVNPLWAAPGKLDARVGVLLEPV